MNLGLLVYGYSHYRGYEPLDVNLGDYIQSIAASQYLGERVHYIDRDGYGKLDKKDAYRFIANGWYFLDDSRHQLHENMQPLITSFHINNVHKPKDFVNVLSYLRDYSRKRSVGCRDKTTMKFLQKNGVRSHFSSCLTTTLRREGFVEDSERRGVVFNDIEFGFSGLSNCDIFPINRFLSKYYLRKKLERRYAQEPIETTTHSFTLNSSHEERFRAAERLLKVYARAKLVVTSRIHAALPCLGMGTPVIYVGNYDRARFPGLIEMLNYVLPSKVSVNFDSEGYVVNSDDFRKYAMSLRRDCSSFFEVE